MFGCLLTLPPTVDGISTGPILSSHGRYVTARGVCPLPIPPPHAHTIILAPYCFLCCCAKVLLSLADRYFSHLLHIHVCSVWRVCMCSPSGEGTIPYVLWELNDWTTSIKDELGHPIHIRSLTSIHLLCIVTFSI